MGELIGRFHPLIVHLPVGILILAFLMEICSRQKRYAYLKTALPFVLQVAIVSAFVSLFTGWIMPKAGDFNDRLVGLHLWFSVGMTISTILVYLLSKTKKDGLKKLYFPMFLLTMILLTITGHYGGSLTHGEGHLTKPANQKKKKLVKDVNSLVAFTDIIEPILASKCYSCHNEGKKKGGLDLTSIESLKQGGDGGAVLLAGNVLGSSLIQRLHLPLEEKEHMPPKGKKQLSDNEVTLLEWWVAEGAPFEKAVGEINQTEELTSILKTYEQSSTAINTKGLSQVTPKQLSQFAAGGVSVIPLDVESPLVHVGFSRDTFLTKGKLKKLKAISKNITELDLSYTNVDDGMLSVLSDFKNLQIYMVIK